MKNKIIIGVIAIVVVIYLLSRKKTGDPLSEVIDSNTNQLSNLMTANRTAVTDDSISEEDMEYNELVNEYKAKYRKKPDASWTITQLKNRIKEYDEIQKAIKVYHEFDGEQKSIEELSKMSLSEINLLIQNEKEKEDEKHLKNLLELFVSTCNNYGSIWNPAGAKNKPWDATTLKQIRDLSDKNLRKLNSMVLSVQDRLYYPENYSMVKAYYKNRTTLVNAIPTGTLCSYRTNAWAANDFVKDIQSRI